MGHIIRSDINEEWAHSGIVEAGDFVFVSYCVGNIGQPIEDRQSLRTAVDKRDFNFNQMLQHIEISVVAST